MRDGGCPRTVLLRYPYGGHCCFATGMGATRFVDAMSADFLSALATKEQRRS